MKVNVWIPMIVIVGLLTLGFVLCLFLPETLERSKVPELSTENGPTAAQRQSIRTRIVQVFQSIQDNLSIFESYLLFGLSITFLLSTLHGYSLDILFQLASARFHWSLGKVSSLHSYVQLTCTDTYQRQASSSQFHPSRLS
jgi:hypothetical protein